MTGVRDFVAGLARAGKYSDWGVWGPGPEEGVHLQDFQEGKSCQKHLGPATQRSEEDTEDR